MPDEQIKFNFAKILQGIFFGAEERESIVAA